MSKKNVLLPVITFTTLIIIWQGVYAAGVYPSYLFPSPGEVGWAIINLAETGKLTEHVLISLMRFLGGYTLAISLAVPLGLIFGWYKSVWQAFDPLVQVLRPISPIAWMPLLALWFGIGNTPAIIIIFLAAFYPILLTTVSAVQSVDPIYLKVAKNFGDTQIHTLMKVVVPATFPTIVVGLRIALGTSWVFLVAGEMMGVRSGLGFLIVDARNAFKTEMVIAGMLLIGILGLIIDKLVRIFEEQVQKRWGKASQEV